MKKLDGKSIKLSSEDQSRLLRLSEESSARLFEASLIIARGVGCDVNGIQVVLGSPKIMQNLATGQGKKIDISQAGSNSLMFCDEDACCFSSDGGGHWYCYAH